MPITETNNDILDLQRARKRVARGWCQSDYTCGRRVCMLGAFGFHGNEDEDEKGDRLANLLGFEACYMMARWNDVAGRTRAEVLARFDEAIAKLSVTL